VTQIHGSKPRRNCNCTAFEGISGLTHEQLRRYNGDSTQDFSAQDSVKAMLLPVLAAVAHSVQVAPCGFLDYLIPLTKTTTRLPRQPISINKLVRDR
jgi:hypothetical protein